MAPESMPAIYINNNLDPFGMPVPKSVYSFITRLGASSNSIVQRNI